MDKWTSGQMDKCYRTTTRGVPQIPGPPVLKIRLMVRPERCDRSAATKVHSLAPVEVAGGTTCWTKSSKSLPVEVPIRNSTSPPDPRPGSGNPRYASTHAPFGRVMSQAIRLGPDAAIEGLVIPPIVTSRVLKTSGFGRRRLAVSTRCASSCTTRVSTRVTWINRTHATPPSIRPIANARHHFIEADYSLLPSSLHVPAIQGASVVDAAAAGAPDVVRQLRVDLPGAVVAPARADVRGDGTRSRDGTGLFHGRTGRRQHVGRPVGGSARSTIVPVRPCGAGDRPLWVPVPFATRCGAAVVR